MGGKVLFKIAFGDEMIGQIDGSFSIIVPQLQFRARTNHHLAKTQSTQSCRFMQRGQTVLVLNVGIGSTVKQVGDKFGPSIHCSQNNRRPLEVEMPVRSILLRTRFQHESSFG